ncbi:MAG: Hsp20/alpha crystallin family protein, partial [Verrucomicrobia bacterium]|nr:Hsp20/alpha crystallin family protein [Verrucomicrobiota bacterium]
MNSLTRRENKWNPLREMEDIQNRMMSLFDNTFGRLPMKKEGGEEKLTFSEWAPLVDISEDENTYCIKAELPEVKKEDLS